MVNTFMKKINRIFWLMLLTACFCSEIGAAPPTQDEILEKLEESWQHLDSYWARFEQINMYSAEEPPQTYIGQLWLQRPNRVRLDYRIVEMDDITGTGPIKEQDITELNLEAATGGLSAPAPKPTPRGKLAAGMEEDVDEMIYSDDINLIYRYDRQDNTLTIMPMQPDSLPLFLAFLVNEQRFRIDRFKKRFTVDSITETHWQGVDTYRLIVSSKDPQDRTRREFWLDKETFLPIRTSTRIGQEQVEVFFKQYKPNADIPADILMGQVPADVKVIDLTSEN